jgi:pyridinium-3,5-bisthiocarboxylic acid mononucleotide nickel chelatase
MKIIYFDPVMGISGDMTISALIDAGCPFPVVMELLRQLPVDLPPIEAEKKRRGAIEGTYLRIGESHAHFSVSEMRRIIADLKTEDRVKGDALAILEIIVDAESKAHGVPKEEVHFHELSHVDTLIDILSVARAMAYFEVTKVFSGPVPHGRGFIKTAHGVMPNPPPATARILSDFQCVFLDEEMELTTPTGAAVLKYYVKGPQRPAFRVVGHGYGFGTRETARPNVLRVFVGESSDIPSDEEVWIVEADMDDAETEYLGAVADRLRDAGALDVLSFPIQMKKGRTGIRLSLITTTASLAGLTDKVLRETSTFGLRFRPEFRRVLDRKEEVRQTSFGQVRVKIGYDSSGVEIKRHIEFEDVRRIADETGIEYRMLLTALQKEL